ncbi:MAG: DUF4328 domain-containing protein [Myxococcota bacterium]
MDRLHPPGTLGDVVTLLLALNAASSLVSLGMASLQSSSLETIEAALAAGMYWDEDQALLIESLYSLSAIGALALLVLTGVVFLVWFFRIYENLAGLGKQGERSVGWAIGAWFVPIVSLFLPYLMMREAWEKSAPREDDLRAAPPLLAVWWLAFLASNVLSRVAGAQTPDPDDFGKLQSVLRWEMTSSAVDALSAVFAVLVVHRMNRRQTDAIAVRRGQPTAPPSAF